MFRLLIRSIMKRSGTPLNDLQKESKTNNKLCFWGIEKFFQPKQCLKHFKKYFGEHENVTHVCKMKNKPFFIVKFSEEINCDEFNKLHAKNKRIKAKQLHDDTQLVNSITQDHYIPIEQVTKNIEVIFKEPSPEELEKVRNTKIQDIVSPLHSLPYEEQVQQKKTDLNRVIENYNTAFFKDPEVKRLIKEEQKEISQLKLDNFIECDKKRQGYRSKCEFTVGVDENDHPVVGFNKGSYHNNTIMVETPKNVNIISKNTKLIVALVEMLIKQVIQSAQYAALKPFHRIKQEGFWRYLIVRESDRTKQSMIVVVCKTSGFEAQLVEKVKKQIVEYLSTKIIGLKSLCFLDYNGQSDSVPTEKPQLLWGEPFYEQKIFDHIFRVSPSAFLQIHMDMCQVLYEKIIQSVKECDIILDLGCGIGTIGISIMKKLQKVKVIGIEICQQAVEDAKKNQPSYEVHLGRAEDHIKSICEMNKGRRIVAILDPPRAGFNKDVMIALRRCRGLDNIIYVACNAGAIQDNLLHLTLPMTTRRKAPQFLIKEMTGFDLFPQTKHYEALYVLQRNY